jgi:hypothetical protein
MPILVQRIVDLAATLVLRDLITDPVREEEVLVVVAVEIDLSFQLTRRGQVEEMTIQEEVVVAVEVIAPGHQVYQLAHVLDGKAWDYPVGPDNRDTDKYNLLPSGRGLPSGRDVSV